MTHGQVSSMPSPISLTQVIWSIAQRAGGPSYSVTGLCEALARSGCKVTLCTLDRSAVMGPAVRVNEQYVTLRAMPAPGWWDGRFAPSGFSALLAECYQQSEIVHTNGMWGPVMSIAAAVARKVDKPYLVTPKGTLDPVSLHRRLWKKSLARLLYVNKAVDGAACLVAAADMEARYIRQAGIRKPVAVIGNGLDTELYSRYDAASARAWLERLRPEIKGKHIMLYLGRMHPQKGTVNLLDAWRWLHRDFPDWHLILVGPDYLGHREELRERAEEEGFLGRLTFLDGIVGDGKVLLYAACDVFVLPSPSENFGVVIAEALASSKPVIATTGTPWQDLREHSCGWWVEPTAECLAQAMREAMSLSNEQNLRMGRAGRELAMSRCSWQAVTSQMKSLYAWILSGGATPPFVSMD